MVANALNDRRVPTDVVAVTVHINPGVGEGAPLLTSSSPKSASPEWSRNGMSRATLYRRIGELDARQWITSQTP